MINNCQICSDASAIQVNLLIRKELLSHDWTAESWWNCWVMMAKYCLHNCTTIFFYFSSFKFINTFCFRNPPHSELLIEKIIKISPLKIIFCDNSNRALKTISIWINRKFFCGNLKICGIIHSNIKLLQFGITAKNYGVTGDSNLRQFQMCVNSNLR